MALIDTFLKVRHLCQDVLHPFGGEIGFSNEDSAFVVAEGQYRFLRLEFEKKDRDIAVSPRIVGKRAAVLHRVLNEHRRSRADRDVVQFSG